MLKKITFASIALVCGIVLASAQAPVKVGMITTLSGSIAYLGEDARVGFQLAVEEENGKLGDATVQILVIDDAAKPGLAKQTAEQMMADGVKIFTGVIGSNVAVAVVPNIILLRKKIVRKIYGSLNVGPSNLADLPLNFHPVATRA